MDRVADAPPPYDAIVFDCDSTLSAIEGIDELARAAGPDLFAAVEDMTRAAMAGAVRMEEVYGRRLDLLRPGRRDLEAVGRRYVERTLPNAGPCVRALLALDKDVHVVSGGLAPAVRALAVELGVAADRVHAVEVRFDDAGGWAGWDTASPLARSGGKPELFASLGLDRARTALVGDGVTDLEAAALCARFVAFGGAVRREEVFARAAVAVDRPDFAAVLARLVGPTELERLRADPEHAPVARAAGDHL